MDKATFEHEMNRGQTFQKLEQDRAEYWIGYQRGLRRAYHGESFGTPAEHALWTASADSDDLLRQQRGEGYRDGLAGHCREMVK
jgi:L-rhamnose isomerase